MHMGSSHSILQEGQSFPGQSLGHFSPQLDFSHLTSQVTPAGFLQTASQLGGSHTGLQIARLGQGG